jgi:hypothetical protein
MRGTGESKEDVERVVNAVANVLVVSTAAGR